MRHICEKAIECNKNVLLCYIDLENAFNKIPWNMLWKALKRKNIPKSLIARIKIPCHNRRNDVHTSKICSNEFTIHEVWQGYIHVLLFLIFQWMMLQKPASMQVLTLLSRILIYLAVVKVDQKSLSQRHGLTGSIESNTKKLYLFIWWNFGWLHCRITFNKLAKLRQWMV